jgi:serine/threonine-protein kinase
MRDPTSLLQDRPAEDIDLGDGRRLRLLEELGQGSSSTVHRALLQHRNGLRRLVAVKIFSRITSEDADQAYALIARAATRAACVVHPNVVEVYDFGRRRGEPFVVTELVEGMNLASLLGRFAERSLRVPLDLALFVACEAAEALSGARTAVDHRGVQVGMLHLSLTPRKVLLGSRGEVKVADFETALAVGTSSSVRNLHELALRTTMLAPEVAQGHDGDSRSDVFSLGLIMREMLVGPRFGRPVTNAEAVRLVREGFVEPMSFQPHLPEPLMSVMVRALEIDPDDRYPNASAMAFELRRIALAMGVGDGRMFLRRTLDHELGNDSCEATSEHAVAQPSVGDDGDGDESDEYAGSDPDDEVTAY